MTTTAEILHVYRPRDLRRPDPGVKVANTGDTDKRPVEYVSVKRPKRNVVNGGESQGEYVTDPVLQAALIDVCAAQGYPLQPGPQDGLPRTMRVPVHLLRNALEDTFEARRGVHAGPGYRCTCSVWRLKTEEEAATDKLPWDEADIDLYRADEAYHVGESRRQKWQKDAGGRLRPDGGPFFAACNPHTCKAVALPHGNANRCKFAGTIYLRARGWASVPIRVETTAWETCHRFPASYDMLEETLGELLIGAPLDLVLNYSRPKSTPGTQRLARPYWTLEIAHGLSPEEARRAALENARQIIADHEEAQALGRQWQALNMEARRPALPEGDDEPAALPDGTDAWATIGQRDAIAVLVGQYGKGQEEAEALVRANAADLPALFARLGPSPEAPPEPQAAADDILDGDFEPEPEPAQPDEEPPPHTDADAPEEPEEPPMVDDAPVAEAEPEPVASRMFATAPETAEAVRDRFSELGEMAAFARMLPVAWKEVTGKPRTALPKPGNVEDPDTYEALIAALISQAERWWDTTGRAQYGGGGGDD